MQSRFDKCWAYLESRGFCDAMGGVEYQRVCAEWWRLCCPLPVICFIHSHANRPTSADQDAHDQPAAAD